MNAAYTLTEETKDFRLYEIDIENQNELKLVAVFPKSWEPAIYLAQHVQEYLQQNQEEIRILLKRIEAWKLSPEEIRALEDNPAGAIFNPDWRSPPGDTIQDILDERGISVEKFAESISMSVYLTEQLLKGDVYINDNIASRLARSLGSSQKFWLNREAKYREPL